MRPKPDILIEQKIGGRPGKMRQVLRSAAVYSIYYMGDPINLCEYDVFDDSDHKYRRTAFSNPGHALLLARKLNHDFGCEDFEVYALTMDGGMKVVERR